MKFFLLASTHGLTVDHYDDYHRAGYSVIIASSRYPVNGCYDHFVKIPGTKTSFAFIEDHIHGIRDAEEVIVKNYIEPGSQRIYSIPEHVYHYCLLGDTHHLTGGFLDAYTFIRENPVDILSSYANPFDAILLSRLIPDIKSIKAFPIELHSTAWRNLSVTHNVLAKQRDSAILLCSTLNQFQRPRSAAIRQVVSDCRLSALFHLYPFQKNLENYHQLLTSFKYSFIPLNGGQISPQLVSSISCGNIPVVTHAEQLRLHHLYSFFRKYTLSLSLDKICASGIEELLVNADSMSLDLRRDLDSFGFQRFAVTTEISFLKSNHYNFKADNAMLAPLSDLSEDTAHDLFATIDELIYNSFPFVYRNAYCKVYLPSKVGMRPDLCELVDMFRFYHGFS